MLVKVGMWEISENYGVDQSKLLSPISGFQVSGISEKGRVTVHGVCSL